MEKLSKTQHIYGIQLLSLSKLLNIMTKQGYSDLIKFDKSSINLCIRAIATQRQRKNNASIVKKQKKIFWR